MKMYLKSFILTLHLSAVLPVVGHCGIKTWVSTSNTSWSTAANWSPSGVPSTTTDTVKFSSGSVNCVMPTTALTVIRLYIEGTYTGTVSKASGNLTINAATKGLTISSGTLTLGTGALLVTSGTTVISGGILNFAGGGGTLTGAYSQTGGTVNCGAGAVTFTGAFTQSGGTFSMGSTSTVNAGSNVTFNNSALTFTANPTSTFKITNTSTLSVSNEPVILFGNMQFVPTATATVTINSSGTSTIRVAGELQRAGSVALTINGDTINALGNVRSLNTNTAAPGTTLFHITGTANQTLTGQGTNGNGRFGDIVINKSAGTLTLSSVISVMGSWTLINGTIAPASSTVWFYNRTTPTNIDMQTSGGQVMSFHNFGVNSGSITLTTDLTVSNNLEIGTLANTANLLSNAKNISVGANWTNTGGTFTSGTGTVLFNGASITSISKTGTSEIFSNLTINKSAVVAVTLNQLVDVTGLLTLTNGFITTTATNLLRMGSSSSVLGGSNTSYVNGPLRKTGNTAFVFPIGHNTVIGTPYHPLGITASATATDAYTAEYKGTVQTSGTAKASTIAALSTCEYWTLQRNTGTNTVTPTLNWNSNCGVSNYAELTVAAWNGSIWNDLSAGTLNAGAPQGSLQAGSAVTFSGSTAVPLLLATKVVNQSYATVSAQLASGYYNTNGNILWFRYEEQYPDANGALNYRIIRLSDNSTVSLMSNSTTTAVPVLIGTNQYKMDLYTAVNTPLAAGMYILEITNDKNEVYRLRFNKN
jgi:hypothetical protein